MNPTDPLEQELMSLRPVPVSPDLRQRVAQRLQEQPTPRHRMQWAAAVMIAIAAATLGVIVALRPTARDNIAVDQQPVPKQTDVTAQLDPELPTRFAYSRALARSPAELDQLLSEHAAWQRPAPDDSSIRAFARWEFSRSKIGDM